MASATLHVLLPVLMATAMNAIIYTTGWNQGSRRMSNRNSYLPPGYIIAIVWTILLAMLGYVHYLTFPQPVHWLIVATIAYCISYPVLTSGFNVAMNALNFIALVMSISVSVATLTVARKPAFLFTIPLLAWASYVNVTGYIASNQKSFDNVA